MNYDDLFGCQRSYYEAKRDANDAAAESLKEKLATHERLEKVIGTQLGATGAKVRVELAELRLAMVRNVHDRVLIEKLLRFDPNGALVSWVGARAFEDHHPAARLSPCPDTDWRELMRVAEMSDAESMENAVRAVYCNWRDVAASLTDDDMEDTALLWHLRSRCVAAALQSARYLLSETSQLCQLVAAKVLSESTKDGTTVRHWDMYEPLPEPDESRLTRDYQAFATKPTAMPINEEDDADEDDCEADL